MDSRGRQAASILILTFSGAVTSRAQPFTLPSSLPSQFVVVTVQDKKGQPVLDLRAEDFVLREDGRPQTVLTFAQASDPGDDNLLGVDITLLVDLSPSVAATTGGSTVAKSLLDFLDAVPRARNRLIVLFQREIVAFRYRPADREAALKLIAGSPTGGGKRLYDAIQLALSRVEARPYRQVIVLLSDGIDTLSDIGEDALLQSVRSSQATIYPAALPHRVPIIGGPPLPPYTQIGGSFLTKLAEATGGEVITVALDGRLTPVYARIQALLSSQYLLGFVSDNSDHDGKYREIKVQLQRPGTRVRCRKGYYALKDRP